MPLYPFRTQSGETVELHFAMADAPSIGTTITRDGRRLTRIASDAQIDPAHNRHQYPYVAFNLPRNLPGCGATRIGEPIIRSKRHEREIMARHGYVKD